MNADESGGIDWDAAIKKNAIAITISREMALDHGLVEPTPKEAAERQASREAHKKRRKASWRLYEGAVAALEAIDDPLVHQIVVLHAAHDSIYGPECQGCDMEGCESENPRWPCRTTAMIAAAYSIDVPDGWDLTGPRPAEDESGPGETVAQVIGRERGML